MPTLGSVSNPIVCIVAPLGSRNLLTAVMLCEPYALPKLASAGCSEESREEMSKGITKKFSDEGKDTQPMLETILRELREFRAETNGRLESLETRLVQVEIDLDKTRAVAHDTRADVRDLRREHQIGSRVINFHGLLELCQRTLA